MKRLMLLLWCWFNSCHLLNALTLDRVILSTNDNENYIQFWPLAARAWKEIVGVRPTLALIGHDNVQIDTSLGDVIRFEPIPGIPTSFYAQCVRLLLPCLFPQDGCIVSDIDLLPLQQKFFTKKIANVSDDAFVVYKDRAYWWWKPRIYMNYNAAKGKIFQQIFGVHCYEDIPERIKEWHKIGLGWSTDEKMLYKYVRRWKKKHNEVVKFGYSKDKKHRICRKEKMKFSSKKLKKQYYVEINCARPYERYKERIDEIMQLAFCAALKKRKAAA